MILLGHESVIKSYINITTNRNEDFVVLFSSIAINLFGSSGGFTFYR